MEENKEEEEEDIGPMPKLIGTLDKQEVKEMIFSAANRPAFVTEEGWAKEMCTGKKL